jgi:uncharacterized membrane-anchored protein YjiN (DUF445 family)
MSILKEAINFEIRELIRQNPKATNQQIADLFDDVSWQSVRANRSHVTMGTDTDNPQPKAKSKKTKKQETFYGIKKLDARNEKVNAILSSELQDGTILTLCGKSLIIENQLFKKGAKEFDYDLVEYKREIFNEILKAVSTSPLNINSINHSTMGKMIHEAYTDKYAHFIADYCNSLNSNKSEIDMALEHNIVKVNGTVSMTFSIRGTQPIMKVKEVDGEAINLTGAKKYFERFENYELVNAFTYKDGTPMMVIILKRIK